MAFTGDGALPRDGQRARLLDGDGLIWAPSAAPPRSPAPGTDRGRSSGPGQARPARRAWAPRGFSPHRRWHGACCSSTGATRRRGRGRGVHRRRGASSRRAACSVPRRRWPHPGGQAPRHRVVLHRGQIAIGFVRVVDAAGPPGMGSSVPLRFVGGVTTLAAFPRVRPGAEGRVRGARRRRCGSSRRSVLGSSTALGSSRVPSAAPPRSPAPGIDRGRACRPGRAWAARWTDRGISALSAPLTSSRLLLLGFFSDLRFGGGLTGGINPTESPPRPQTRHGTPNHRRHIETVPSCRWFCEYVSLQR